MSDLVPVFDGHNDTILKLELAERTGIEVDFSGPEAPTDIDLARSRRAGFAGGFFAMFTPAQFRGERTKFDPDDPIHFQPVDQAYALTFTMAMFARLRRLARQMPDDLCVCADANQIRTAMEAGQIAILPHIEGAECIDTDLAALEVLYAAGLRSLGLVWSRSNAFGHGAPMQAEPVLDPRQGLTDAGLALVRECERLGVLVDLSHLTERGFWDVARIAERPLIATHSNVFAISPTPRNLTDKQLAAVAESGGVVGLNFHVGFLREDCRMNSDTPISQMLRHLDHMLEILGEDGVALGSDYDGCLLPKEIGDVTGLPRLVAAMRQAGYDAPLIAKICRENWLAALDRAGVAA